MIAILTGVRWYPIAILIYIPLMIIDVGHFFPVLVGYWMSSLKKLLFSSYILDINPLSDIRFLNIFPHPISCLSLFWLFLFLCRFSVYYSSTYWFLLLMSYTKTFCQGDFVKEIFPLFTSRSFMVSDLVFKSLIHFKLIFVRSVR